MSEINESGNATKLWFKAKNYGWGWCPVSWEGWTATLVAVLLLVWEFFRIDLYSHSTGDFLINFFIPFVGIMVLLIFVCYGRGEKPKWRWGNSKK